MGSGRSLWLISGLGMTSKISIRRSRRAPQRLREDKWGWGSKKAASCGLGRVIWCCLMKWNSLRCHSIVMCLVGIKISIRSIFGMIAEYMTWWVGVASWSTEVVWRTTGRYVVAMPSGNNTRWDRVLRPVVEWLWRSQNKKGRTARIWCLSCSALR